MRSSKQLLSCLVFSVFLLAFSKMPLFAEDGEVTLDVQNISIEEVLKMIADQSGMSVVLSTNVTGNVSVKLDKVTVIQALDSVLKANNYLYSVTDGIITVYSYQDTQQQERFVNLQTKVITLDYTDVADLKRILLSMKTARGRIETNEKSNQVIITDTPEKVREVEEALRQLDQQTDIKKYKLLYSKAADMEAKLLQLIPKEKGDVYVDERTNTIVVRATPVILKNIDSFIEGWDSQHKQVMIEAMIMEITLDDTTKLGIEWEHAYDRTGEDPHHNPGALDLLTDFGLNLATGGTGGIYKIGGLTPDEYSITIEALKSNANTEVLSSPRIVVIDGESANILIGSSEPYAVATTDPVTKLLVQDIKYVDVGIKLEVTPQIGEDNYVTMKIHPEVSTARRVAEVDNVVAKDTTQADTTMMVKDGETIILGGLIKNDKKRTINKVPFLGDIPIIGLAFQNRSWQDVKKEVLVFITPHILTSDNRQNISRQKYQDSIDRTERIDPIIEDAIEKSGGVELTPYETEKIRGYAEGPDENPGYQGRVIHDYGTWAGAGFYQDYLQIIFHRKWFFMLPFVIVFFTASIGSFFLPKYYRSSVLILVEEEKPVNPLATKELAYTSSTGQPPTLAEQLKTLTEKILSYPRLLTLVKTLGLDKGVTDQVMYEKMLMGIRKRSQVKMRSPEVFQVSYEDKDPVAARNVTKTIIEIFIDENKSKKTAQAATAIKFAEEQAKIYKKKLEESAKKLFDFRAQYPMQLPGKELDYNVSMLTSYQTSLTAVEMALKESERKLDLLKRQMSGKDPVIISEELMELNPAVSRLNSQLQNLQSQHDQMMAEKPESSDLASIQIQMEDTREKLRLETEKMVDSDTSTTAPLFFQRLSQKVKDAEKEVNDLRKRREQLSKLVKDYESKIQTLPEQERELALLTRDSEVNENVYKMLMLKIEENKLSSAEAQEKSTKYTVIDEPRMPLKPSKPEVLIIGVVAFILGVISGFGCVFLAEFADHSFRGVEDARPFLKHEIFGGISAIVDKNEAAAKAAKQRGLAVFLIALYVTLFTVAVISYNVGQDEVRKRVIEIANKEKAAGVGRNAK